MIYAAFVLVLFVLLLLVLWHETPKVNVVSATGQQKKLKSEVAYENPARGPDHCGGCRYFELIEPNHCSKVQGIIVASAWCRLFKEK